MILFFDTSALVKFFHREEGTDVVVSIISDLNNEVWVVFLSNRDLIGQNYTVLAEDCGTKKMPRSM